MNAAALAEQDRRTLLHPFTNLKAFAAGDTGGPRVIASGDGIRIRDTHGNVLIDAFAGLYCVNVDTAARRLPMRSTRRQRIWPTTTATWATRRK